MEQIQKTKPGMTSDRERASNGPAGPYTVSPVASSTRKVDKLGRIQLTGAAGNLLHVGEGDTVKISADTQKGMLLVRRVEPSETGNDRDPFVRKVDRLGRIVLPMEMRAQLDIREEELLELITDPDNSQVYIKKAVNKCLKCGASEGLTEIRPGYYLCASCMEAISAHK